MSRNTTSSSLSLKQTIRNHEDQVNYTLLCEPGAGFRLPRETVALENGLMEKKLRIPARSPEK